MHSAKSSRYLLHTPAVKHELGLALSPTRHPEHGQSAEHARYAHSLHRDHRDASAAPDGLRAPRHCACAPSPPRRASLRRLAASPRPPDHSHQLSRTSLAPRPRSSRQLRAAEAERASCKRFERRRRRARRSMPAMWPSHGWRGSGWRLTARARRQRARRATRHRPPCGSYTY